jgi:hypothetical protein
MYTACKSCEEARKAGQYRWRMSCDKPECFQVLLVLTDFNYGYITKYEARDRLVGVLSDDMLPYDPPAKVLIDRIYKEDQTVSSESQESNAEDQVVEEPADTNEEPAVGIISEPNQDFVTNDEPETVVNDINYFDEVDSDI